MFCRSLFVLLYFFLLAIVLSVFLRYTDSDSSMPNLGFSVKCLVNHCVIFGISSPAIYYTPTLKWGLYCNHLVRPSVRPSVRPFVRPSVRLSVRPFVRPSVHTFVTDISASTGRNDFILDIWLWHGDLYRVSPFQVYRTSTSCLPYDLQMNEWGYS